MTREELKEHCEKQIKASEMWAHSQGERPYGKVYEEHKLILELLEQEPVLDKIKAEIEKLQKMCDKNDLNLMAQYSAFGMVLDILDKYKADMEQEDGLSRTTL